MGEESVQSWEVMRCFNAGKKGGCPISSKKEKLRTEGCNELPWY